MYKINLLSIRLVVLTTISVFYLSLISCDERSNYNGGNTDTELALAKENLAKAKDILAKWESLTTADFLEKAGNALKNIHFSTGMPTYSQNPSADIIFSGGINSGDFLIDFANQIRLNNPNDPGNNFDANLFASFRKITEADIKGKDLSGIEKFVEKTKK